MKRFGNRSKFVGDKYTHVHIAICVKDGKSNDKKRFFFFL